MKPNVSLAEVMQRPTPCEGCPSLVKCKYHTWACDNFARYVEYGEWGHTRMCLPSRDIYDRIFSDIEE